MDTIKTYLENVFAAFPQDSRILALKKEMLAGMEEKYLELKAQGKGENEAVGSVIANFGSIDDIIAEMGINKIESEPDTRLLLTGDEARNYLGFMKKSSVLLSLGVGLILIGISLLLGLSSLNSILDISHELATSLGMMIFFFIVAIAVTIFIVTGMRMSKFENYENMGIRLHLQIYEEIKQQSENFAPKFIAHIASGVVLILLAAGIFMFLSSLDLGVISLIFLLIMIGIAVSIFITGGMIKNSYDLLLGMGGYDRRKYKRSKKGEKVIGTVSSIYWPLVVALYLLWSFLGDDAWGRSWIIWPIAGVLFGAIAGGLGAWFYGGQDSK